MNNVLSSMQMLETSDVCNKFSTSVSYETLVGGTATTGTEYKQTQRLFLGSANKPLTAVGTLTSLLCNSAKVVEKLLRHVITRRTSVRRGYLPEQGTHTNKESLFANVTCFMRLPRRIQRMLLVMTEKALSFLRLRGASGAQGISTPASCRKAHKRRFLFNLIRRSLEKFFKKNFRDDSSCFGFAKILAIALLLAFITTAESSAECVGATETTAGTDNITGAHCGICGTNCNWKIDGDTLKVTGGTNGEIGHMNAGAQMINNVYTYVMPWGGLFNEFSKVDISGVENVGSAAFRPNNHITDIKLDDSITKIENYAFAGSKVKTIILPDSLKTLELRAFSEEYNNTLEEVVLPDTLLPFAGNSHFGANPEQLSNLKIICLGDTQKCQNVLSKYRYWESTPEGARSIPFSLAGNVIPADYKYCNTTNYFWDGSTCIREPDLSKRKCCDSCKDIGGWCNRVRYTPAEAAEVLRDDDTNSVTITFRK